MKYYKDTVVPKWFYKDDGKDFWFLSKNGPYWRITGSWRISDIPKNNLIDRIEEMTKEEAFIEFL